MRINTLLFFSAICILCSSNSIAQENKTSSNKLSIETFGQKNAKDSTELLVKLNGPVESKIYFTLDGTEPTKKSKTYTAPFTVSKSCTLKAAAYVKKSKLASTLSRNMMVCPSSAKQVFIPYSWGVKSNRDSAILTNGLKELEFGSYKDAIVWEGTDATVIIDMYKLKLWTEIKISCAIDKSKMCYPPSGFDLYYSDDKVVFNSAIFPKPEIMDNNGLRTYSFKFNAPVYGRFIKVVVYSAGKIKNDTTGNSDNTLIVIDEIGVN